MQARYRSDYPGEFIVLETRWSGGKKNQKREWIANPIENHHISGRAACIAGDFDIGHFDYSRLQRHRGGLLGSKKLQTYGTGPVAQDIRLDFACESDPGRLQQLIESGYTDQNIVYTTNRNCIQNPGLCYIVPYRPNVLDLALIVYLAAFDGHQEIFMLGYNKETRVDNPAWQDQISQVISAYSSSLFYFVGEPTNMFDSWLELPNTKSLTHREFISYCDI